MLYSNEDIKTLADKMREISRRWNEAQKASRFKSFTAGVLEPFANVDDMLGNMLESFGLMKKSSPTSVRNDMLGYLLGNKNVRKGYKVAGNLLGDLTTAMAISEVRAMKSLPYIGGLLSGGLSGGLTGYAASSGTAAERAVSAAVSAVTGGVLGSIGQKVGGARTAQRQKEFKEATRELEKNKVGIIGEIRNTGITNDRLRALLPDIETKAFDKVEQDIAQYASNLSPEAISNLLHTGRITKDINFKNSFFKNKIVPLIEDHTIQSVNGSKNLRGEDQIALIRSLKEAARDSNIPISEQTYFNKIADYLQKHLLFSDNVPKQVVEKYSRTNQIWSMLKDLQGTEGYKIMENKISQLLDNGLINNNVAVEFLLQSAASLPKKTKGQFANHILNFIKDNNINITDPIILKRIQALQKSSNLMFDKTLSKTSQSLGGLLGQTYLD